MERVNVTDDKSLVSKGVGYWSQREIFFNTLDDPFLLRDDISFEEILQNIRSLSDYLAQEHLAAYLEGWIGKNYNGVFSLDDISALPTNDWSVLCDELLRQKYSESEIASHIAEAWWGQHKEQPYNGIDKAQLHRLPSVLAPLFIDWQSVEAREPKDFIARLYSLSQLNTRLDRFGYADLGEINSAERMRLLITNLPARERAMTRWVVPILASESDLKLFYHGMMRAIDAASCLLVWLRAQNLLLLPANTDRVAQWVTEFSVWPDTTLDDDDAQQAIRTGLPRLMVSSTINGLNDIPKNLLELFPAQKIAPGLLYTLRNWLTRPDIAANRPVFPVDYLLPHYQRAKTHIHKWSPEWVSSYINDEWGQFANIWWLHKTTDNHKRNSLRSLLEWAWFKQSFQSPWDIRPENLRNPHRPDIQDTYFHYLKAGAIDNRASCWQGSAILYKVVCQYAVLPDSPYPDHSIIRNPFKEIDNPFQHINKRGNKTPRSRMLPSIQEMMIDVLLDPDENGQPTFTWAKSAFGYSSSDWVAIPDPDNPGKNIRVWNPSRAACLAVLLLTPLRGAQARWLDQGLMDSKIYDLLSGKMVANKHALKNFRYANGKTHEAQYGRNSGVLQYYSDPLNGQEELCLFINTNKTQMWDGTKKTGYEMPWPDGRELLNSELPELRDQGRWLARLYDVIRYQLSWMYQYDPDPKPLSFFDVREDRGRTTDLADVRDALPYFVPLFRNLDHIGWTSYNLNGEPVLARRPVSKSSLESLYNRLAEETEKRLRDQGIEIYLTMKDESGSGCKCTYGIHSLRVAGISRLIEMGVPAHIVQEYVAGHQAIATTIYYLKHSPFYLREQLLKAMTEQDVCEGMEVVLERLRSGQLAHNAIFANNPRFDNDVDELPKDYAAFAPVEGGLCPMGGVGSRCDQGGIADQVNEGSGEVNSIYGQVQGGCGNCRFFLTGPDFMLQQVLAANSLMLKLRAMGRERKQLYTQLDLIKNELHSVSHEHSARRQRLEMEKFGLLEKLKDCDERLAPLILEWVNRYKYLQASQDMMGKRIAEGSNASSLVLIGSQTLTEQDFSIEVLQSNDFGLVRMTIEQARFYQRKGIPMPDDASRMLREFVNIILAEHSPENLLLKVPDPVYATHAASIIAGWLSEKVGDEAIQESIDERRPLTLTLEQKVTLKKLVDTVIPLACKGHTSQFDIDYLPASTDKRGMKQ